MRRKLYLSILLLFVITTFGCEEIANSLIECGIKGVELKNKTLKQATKDQSYYETIKANVKNDPIDESNEFAFTISGSLPDGIFVTQTDNILEIQGIATETGTFPFQVMVEVDYFDDTLDLCSESKSNDYVLVVT